MQAPPPSPPPPVQPAEEQQQETEQPATREPSVAKAAVAATSAAAAPPKPAPAISAFTVATGQDGYYDALLLSAARSGVQLEVLGQGEKWRGFVWRLRMIDAKLASMADDAMVLVTDGYDTLVLASAEELLEAYERTCEAQRVVDASCLAEDSQTACPTPSATARAQGVDGEAYVALAPEHPKSWCTWLFYNIFVRISKLTMFGVPNSTPYVVNAGIILGPCKAVRQYYAALFAESDATRHEPGAKPEDDQWLLNRLYWSGQLPVPLAIDMAGRVAYCHANRSAWGISSSTFVDQDCHRIRHAKYLELGPTGEMRVKRSGAKVGVLHAIVNADVDELCVLRDLPICKHRKHYAQFWMHLFILSLRWAVYLTLAYLVAKGAAMLLQGAVHQWLYAAVPIKLLP